MIDSHNQRTFSIVSGAYLHPTGRHKPPVPSKHLQHLRGKSHLYLGQLLKSEQYSLPGLRDQLTPFECQQNRALRLLQGQPIASRRLVDWMVQISLLLSLGGSCSNCKARQQGG